MEAGQPNQCKQVVGNNYRLRDGSLGLVVMGGDSCSEGCGFKSQHCILEGHFSHLFVVKIVMFVLKKTKINEKEAGYGPFLKK